MESIDNVRRNNNNDNNDKVHNNKIQIVYSCLIIPIVFTLWWLYTKRVARRVVRKLLILLPASQQSEEEGTTTATYFTRDYSRRSISDNRVGSYIQHEISTDDETSTHSGDQYLHNGLPINTWKDCYNSWDDLVSEQDGSKRTSMGLVKWLTLGKTKKNINSNPSSSINNKNNNKNDDNDGERCKNSLFRISNVRYRRPTRRNFVAIDPTSDTRNTTNFDVPETEFIMMNNDDDNNVIKTHRNDSFDGSVSISVVSIHDYTNGNHNDANNNNNNNNMSMEEYKEQWQCIPDTIAAIEMCTISFRTDLMNCASVREEDDNDDNDDIVDVDVDINGIESTIVEIDDEVQSNDTKLLWFSMR